MPTAKKKGAGSRKNASRKAAAARAAKREAEERAREMWGVAFASTGILLGIYMFVSKQGLLGIWFSQFLFGLFGTLCYCLPALLIWCAYVNIFSDEHPRLRGSGSCLLLGIVSVMVLLQVIHTTEFSGVRYLDYLKASYAVSSESHIGGGFTGGLFAYPILLLGGKALGYILPIAGILFTCMLVFRLSIRRTARRVSSGVSSTAARIRTDYEENREILARRAEERRARREEKMAFFSVREGDSPSDAGARGAGLPAAPGRSATAPEADDPAPRRRKKQEPETLADLMDSMLEGLPASDPKPAPERPKHVISDTGENIRSYPARFTDGEAAAIPGREDPIPETQYYRSVMPRDPESPAPGEDESEAPVPHGIPEEAFPAAEEPSTETAPAPSGKQPAPESLPSPQEDVYAPPPLSLLNAPKAKSDGSREGPEERGRLLIETLQSFGIDCRLTDVSVGPVLTRYELSPAPGVRVSRIEALSNDLALALAAERVRIEAPIPGKAAVGIEVPNRNAATVVLREIVESREFTEASSPITLAFGKGISGKVITADLGKMPHLLIAGSTGSGKSVCINDLIISMVYKSSPKDLRFVLIDPKMVELTSYAGLPHMLMPVVTEPKKAAGALRWAVNEMTKRYNSFAEKGARELTRYNMLLERETPGSRLPRIVIIIDELADLMMVAAEDVEDCISRIAALGRAAGIHLIVATQRPSADVITGVIKANIPSRCAFMVSSGIDSRIILDMTGAEKLIGRGDMLFHMNGAGKPIRLQCAFVSDEEVERVVDYFVVRQRTPSFDEQVMEEVNSAAVGGPSGGAFGEGKQEDDLMAEAVRVVIEAGQASTSLLQRRLRVGYARGSRLLDMMEQAGYVSTQDGSKPRRVLIKRSQYEEVFGVALPPPDSQGNGDA